MANDTGHQTMPAWMAKHPCVACGTGYGNCSQFALASFKCCKGCEHPTRWTPDPWTDDDLAEMWRGREADMPEAVRQRLAAADATR